MIILDLYNLLFFGPLVNLLILIYKLLVSVGIPGALGFSILLITLGIRLIIWPITATQVKSAQKMASMKPHLDKLKLKHKEDKKALQIAQMNLYKEHGINPASGCLPALIQIPVFIALYRSIFDVFDAHQLENINKFLYNDWLRLSAPPDPNFFGLNLTAKPADFGQYGILILLVPLVTGLLTFVQSKMMSPKPLKVYPSDSPKEKKEKEGAEDMMASMQTQMVYLMPVMVGYFAYSFPVGLAIYWNTFTIMGIVQQYQVSGWGGLESLVQSVKGKVQSQK